MSSLLYTHCSRTRHGWLTFQKGKIMSTQLEFERTPSPYLGPSTLLDYSHPSIEKLIQSKGWNPIADDPKVIKEIYLFVRDEIAYGYTKSFSIPASQVLAYGLGNGITKSTLFMALLRAVGIPCRIHAMVISKVIFRGLLSGVCYRIADRHPYRAWVEIQYKDTWYAIDGFIIDSLYMANLQQKFINQKGSFYGYGIAVLDFRNRDNKWNNNHIFVQNKAIEKDLGNFHTPDAFFSGVPKAENYGRALRYRAIICPHLNKSIQRIRNSK